MLELRNISKTFFPGTVHEKTALDDLSLTLHEGDFVTVIGGNGAGKSTMQNAGKDVTKLPEYKRAALLGRVFQDPMMGTAPTMQIQENLALAARRGQHRGLKWGITQQEQQEYFRRLKELDLGLEDRMKAKVGLLSGGQRQALLGLLLLDEHTAALDPRTAAKGLELSDRIVEENHLTTLMITHNMKDAIAHGNRLIMMDAGHIVLDISGEEKKKLTVTDLLTLFSKASGTEANDDKLLLS